MNDSPFVMISQSNQWTSRSARQLVTIDANTRRQSDLNIYDRSSLSMRSSCGITQYSKVVPIKSPSRQISRHWRMVRKLSKDTPKSDGTKLRPDNRMPAPSFVTSRTQQECTLELPMKNSKAPRLTTVRPLDRRSIRPSRAGGGREADILLCVNWFAIGIFDDLFVNPMPSLATSPHLSPNQFSSDRSAWNNDTPQVPDRLPSGICGRHLTSPANWTSYERSDPVGISTIRPRQYRLGRLGNIRR